MRPPGPTDVLAEDLPELGLDAIAALIEEYGPVIRVEYAHKDNPAFLFGSPEHVQHVFATRRKNYVKGYGMERVRILMGNGLIVSDGDLWRRQRRMIQPAFHRRVIAGLVGSMRRNNQALLDRWTVAADRNDAVNVGEDVSAMTLKILLEAIFSEDLAQMVGGEGVGPFGIVADESARDLLFAQRFRALGKLVREVMRRRRADGIERPDLLGMMLAARDDATGDPMPDRLLVDEVFTLIIAGHETTAEMLAWCWHLLGKNPEAQAKLQAEAQGSPELGRHVVGRNPEAQAKLQAEAQGSPELGKYARQVAQEALRLYPPVWIIPRRPLEDDVVAGCPVPAGADVFVSPYFMHRRADLWPEPERFRPERFDAPIESRYSYLPFGAGPRLCMGDHLALTEAQVHLGMVARTLRLDRVDDREMILEPRINLRMKGPLMMRPVRIDRPASAESSHVRV